MLPVLAVMSWIIAGVTNHLHRVEYRGQCKQLVQSRATHLPNGRIDAARAQVPERTMQGQVNAGCMQFVHDFSGFRLRQAVQIHAAQTDFEVETVFQNHIQVPWKMLPGHVDMDLPNYLAHLGVELQLHFTVRSQYLSQSMRP